MREEVEEEGEEGEDQLRRRLLFDVVSSLSLDCIHQRQENEGKKGKTCQLYRSQKMCLAFGPKESEEKANRWNGCREGGGREDEPILAVSTDSKKRMRCQLTQVF